MKIFYLHNGQAQQGPFTLEELNSMNLSRDTPVWYDGLPSWQPASHIEELKNLFISPPPFNAKPVSMEQKSIPGASSTFKASTFLGKNLRILLSIVALVLAAIFIYKQVDQQQQAADRVSLKQQEEDTRQSIRENITSFVIAERNTYQYSSLGGIYNLKITVKNNTDYILDNVKVKVTYIKSDGAVWNDKILDFYLVDPNTRVTIPVEDTERGVKVNYEIISIKSAALGL